MVSVTRRPATAADSACAGIARTSSWPGFGTTMRPGGSISRGSAGCACTECGDEQHGQHWPEESRRGAVAASKHLHVRPDEGEHLQVPERGLHAEAMAGL